MLSRAEDACVAPVRMAQLAQEVGFPSGALNVVTGIGEEAGAALASHPGIDFLSFTGSPEVGTLVQRSIYDKFVAQVVARFKQLRVGSHAMDLDCGPLISENQKKRVHSFIDRAKKDGIPVLAEAQIADGVPSGGFYVAPVLFGPVPRDNALACDEVFGPVLSIIAFEDEADAIKMANSTQFGLVAGIWTRDGARQMRVAKKMRCGQVFVNGYGAGGGIELPFGGVKKSGHGREKGMEALHEFSHTKTIVFKHG